MPNSYYNRYDPTTGWKDVRFVAGRHLQSAELNEMQSIALDNTRLLANTAVGLKSGQITRGMSFRCLTSMTRHGVAWSRNGTVATITQENHILDVGDSITVSGSSSTAAISNAAHTVVSVGDGVFTIACSNAGLTTGTLNYTHAKTPNKIAQIDSGIVYVSGIFHTFQGGIVEITGVGDETIGILLEQVIVTEVDDPTLNDPAIGQDPGYGLPGAYRTTYKLTLAVDDPNAIPIYKIRDGAIIVPPKVDPFEPFYAILARRTNDESGSYMVWGLRASVTTKDAAYFNLNIAAGKAYVQGWEWTKPITTTINLRRPLDADDAPNETHLYTTGQNAITLYMTPVKQVDEVVVTIQRTTTIVRGGSPGGSDTILEPSYGSVVGGSVSGVSYSGNNYSVGTHYTVTGNLISWAPAGTGITEEPPTGATYNITYQFTRIYVPTTDYTVSSTGINITPASEKPVNGSTMLITYKPYLERYDSVVMDAKGVISVVEGAPDYLLGTDHYAHLPKLPTGVLKLADIYLPPNGAATACEVSTSNQYRKTMSEIVRMADRVSDLEYNLAVTDLENSAFNIGLTSTKKSIFTDNFVNPSKMDLQHSLSETYPASVDFNYTLHPGHVFAFHALTGSTERLTLPQTSIVTATQMGATESQLVNPYAMFDSATLLNLTPDDDITINNTNINLVLALEYAPYGSSLYYNWWEEMHAAGSLWQLIDSNGGAYSKWKQTTTSQTETKVIGVSNARTVTVTGAGFIPNSDSLRLTFDGTPLDLTAVSPTEVGTPVDGKTTVKSNSGGGFTATFNVSAGIIGGEKHVRVYNGNNSGEAIYSIGTINRVTTTTVRTRQIDPVAQTFALNETQLISGVDLFFTAKDAALPVRVSIQNVVNGFPGQNVLAEKLIYPASVNVSSTGSTPTQVRFDIPALCSNEEEYCIVVASTSNVYQLAIARLGHADLTTGQVVSKNPYSGVMFTSSNATSWSPDQTADVKFVLYRAAFSPTTATTYFDQMTVTGTYFCLYANAAIPPGCSVQWYYSANGAAWRTCQPGITIHPGVLMTTLRFAVIITGTSYLAPIVGRNAVVLVGKHNLDSEYVSRNTDLETLGESAYSNLDIYLDVKTPGSSTIAVYYAKDGTGTTWVSAGSGTTVTSLADGYTQKKYSLSGISGSPTDMRLRIKLTTSTDRVSYPTVRRAMMISS